MVSAAVFGRCRPGAGEAAGKDGSVRAGSEVINDLHFVDPIVAEVVAIPEAVCVVFQNIV